MIVIVVVVIVIVGILFWEFLFKCFFCVERILLIHLFLGPTYGEITKKKRILSSTTSLLCNKVAPLFLSSFFPLED